MTAAAIPSRRPRIDGETHMTREAIQSLPTSELRAIVRSTSPTGRFWLELVWAKDELCRRATRH